MSDEARSTLKQLVDKHGPRLAGEPGRLKGFFGDYCPKQYMQSSLLVTVAEQGMTKELAGARAHSLAGMIPGMVDSLHNSRGMKRQDAQWAVESWALAFGLSLPSEAPKKQQMIVKAICSREKLWFAIVFEQDALGNWLAKRSFKVKEGQKQAGHGAGVISGNILFSHEYSGCPHCGEKFSCYCTGCHTMNCYGSVERVDSEQHFFTCGQCSLSGYLGGTIEKINGYSDL